MLIRQVRGTLKDAQELSQQLQIQGYSVTIVPAGLNLWRLFCVKRRK